MVGVGAGEEIVGAVSVGETVGTSVGSEEEQAANVRSSAAIPINQKDFLCIKLDGRRAFNCRGSDIATARLHWKSSGIIGLDFGSKIDN